MVLGCIGVMELGGIVQIPKILYRIYKGSSGGIQVVIIVYLSKLESNRGEVAYFCIQSPEYDSTNPYPKAHTCFNRLELPKYPNKEVLEMYLKATLNDALHG